MFYSSRLVLNWCFNIRGKILSICNTLATNATKKAYLSLLSPQASAEPKGEDGQPQEEEPGHPPRELGGERGGSMAMV